MLEMLPFIHHRRESACSLDIGVWYKLLSTLQRVVGLRPRLVRSLGSGEVEGSRGSPRAADGGCRVGIGTEAAV